MDKKITGTGLDKIINETVKKVLKEDYVYHDGQFHRMSKNIGNEKYYEEFEWEVATLLDMAKSLGNALDRRDDDEIAKTAKILYNGAYGYLKTYGKFINRQ